MIKQLPFVLQKQVENSGGKIVSATIMNSDGLFDFADHDY